MANESIELQKRSLDLRAEQAKRNAAAIAAERAALDKVQRLDARKQASSPAANKAIIPSIENKAAKDALAAVPLTAEARKLAGSLGLTAKDLTKPGKKGGKQLTEKDVKRISGGGKP